MAADVDEYATDAGVETITKIHALGLGQGVLMECFAGELQQRAVDFRGQATAGEEVGLIALIGAGRIVEPPGGVLLTHVEGRLEAGGAPDFFRQRDIL